MTRQYAILSCRNCLKFLKYFEPIRHETPGSIGGSSGSDISSQLRQAHIVLMTNPD
jgi:hypothetical protein